MLNTTNQSLHLLHEYYICFSIVVVFQYKHLDLHVRYTIRKKLIPANILTLYMFKLKKKNISVQTQISHFNIHMLEYP